MTLLKRGLIALVVVIVFGLIGFNLFKKQIGMALFERVVAERVGVDRSAELPDGLHVYLCGAGAPFPDRSRAAPCLGVIAGTRAYVFDVGSGGTRNLGTMGFPLDRIEAIYLTHLHSDHLDGLGELLVLSWVAGTRTTPTPIIGPIGTQEVVDGFNMAYRLDSTYRTAHHGSDVAHPDGFGGLATEITLPAGPAGKAVVFEDDVLTITAIRVDHAPVDPAFGYRIDYKDRSVAISGDTVYHPGFVGAARDVDLMMHEALDPDMVSIMGEQLAARGQVTNAKIMADILDYHASPEDAARAAQDAGAGELVLYHIVPPLPVKMLEAAYLGDAPSEFDGDITVGEDGLLISLPSGSDQIKKSRAF